MDLDASPRVPHKLDVQRRGPTVQERVHAARRKERSLAESPDLRPGTLRHFTVKEIGKVADLLGKMRTKPTAISVPAPSTRSETVPSLDKEAIEQPLQIVHPIKGAKSWRCLGYRSPEIDVVFDGPPKPEQVRQGYIGDCWAIAVLAQAAALEPQELQQRITKVAPQVYEVRLGGPDSPPESIYRIDTSLPEIQARFSHIGRKRTIGTHASLDSGVLWPVLFEKALAADVPNGYEDIGHGGNPDWAISRLLDRPTYSSHMPSRESWNDDQMDGFFRQQLEEHLPTVFSVHVPDGNTKIPLPDGMSRRKGFHYRREQKKEMHDLQNMAQEVGLLAREDNYHAYWLYDYDPINQMVKLANPHGIEFTSDWISFDQLRKLAYHISYGEIRQDGT
ncbi:MAG: hypothetical protein ACP5OR_05785 [Candidatus Dormibacteria bacterium]